MYMLGMNSELLLNFVYKLKLKLLFFLHTQKEKKNSEENYLLPSLA
jgi:hypothetical protein